LVQAGFSSAALRPFAFAGPVQVGDVSPGHAGKEGVVACGAAAQPIVLRLAGGRHVHALVPGGQVLPGAAAGPCDVEAAFLVGKERDVHRPRHARFVDPALKEALAGAFHGLFPQATDRHPGTRRGARDHFKGGCVGLAGIEGRRPTTLLKASVSILPMNAPRSLRAR
jgi:hypothetical protein